jgi:hypothetical protein
MGGACGMYGGEVHIMYWSRNTRKGSHWKT